MKRNYRHFIFAILAVFAFSTDIYAEPQTLTLDNQHTYVLWKVKHLGFSTQAGKWYANGQLVLDKDNPQQSKVNVTIKIDDIVTGIPELDKHLKGKLFFDTKQFPKATFVSDKVEVTGKNKAKVYGMLTLHGVTKPIILDVVFNKAGINLLNDRETVGFSATTSLKRSDYGIKALIPEVGDDVEIEIEAEAYLDKKYG
ncbi:TPA: YceI family protein [Legionella pneumophila]|uniref:YceI family protein n=1 Tax=Legionella pneumophila TaxID=446 RepID=UPI0007895340|nr:YceI family protein [Legionella pneumophila]MDW8879970.1 YceI family protein [Legionella pneumophila subsp. fraseri]MDW8962829.1 YceI family protein [Legionella pneumophila subsp. fraseri]MDW9036356.1 YceI family protein [Legionella pneumophila subsp. fraseri]MDW9039560.1 YceI family protein [Legionella pneumophila subsp. fraseri]MDW9042550.1 YceI family protein [Legionella pneumophila subsp. fraseri]